MPHSKMNFIIAYKNNPQIFGAQSKDIALSSPPPEGSTLAEKKVWFVSYEPDTGYIVKYEIPEEDVLNAEIKYPKTRKKENDENS